MRVYKLDEIIRSALLTTQKPIHYYMQYLHYGLKAVREIGYDSPYVTKSIKLAVNNNNEISLPSDYVDYVRVGWSNGQFVKKLIEKDSFNRLVNRDSNGNQIPYSDVETDQGLIHDNNDSHSNDKGEHVGRHFGHKPSYKNSFMVIPERSVIMLDPSLHLVKHIVIDYIATNLAYKDQPTSVPAYAAEPIERYILWRVTEQDRTVPMNSKLMAKEEWLQSHKRYRSRNYKLSLDDILKSLRSHTFAAIKS